MAHLPQMPPLYANGVKASEQTKFPDTDVFRGFNKPSRIEGDIYELEVDGAIPAAINGTFYRIQGDHRFPPMYENDIHFNGDGQVGAFRIQNGHVDWKQRYIRTERFAAETAARRNLFGKYRNPYTDHPTVRGIIRTASNTNIFFWRGVLLGLKEDGPPFALKPDTLDTIGRYDFDGQIRAPTFTAHPKVDPATGELVCFAYEAGGNGNDASRAVVVWTVGADGRKTEEAWYEAPFCGIIHDVGFTEHWVILPMTPLKADLERIKRGGNHWAWDPNEDQYYGIFPRRGGRPEDARWVRSKTGFHGHVANAYEEGGKIVFDIGVADGNVFWFFPPEDQEAGKIAQRNKLYSPMTRWVFDPEQLKDGDWVEPERECDFSCEFTRIDDRFQGKDYTQYWTLQVDVSRPYNFEKCGGPGGGLFNVLTHYNWQTGEKDEWWPGDCSTLQEPVFIPRSEDAPEGHGWVLCLENRLDELRNNIVILDAQNLKDGPIAIVRLPLKFRLGFHGNWVDHSEIEAFEQLRKEGGELGPVQPAKEPLPWQLGQHVNGERNGA
ncbi:putative carotenoid oxygenase protein [Neofusicoccum parvum]|nr:putative carotenoid oxygenase protein [Neofusicoccum parvum]